MEGAEVSAQVVAPPIFLHQPLAGRFHDMPPLARKRDLAWQNPSYNHTPHQSQHQGMISTAYANPGANWSSKAWDWDSVMFVAKPSSDDGALRFGNHVVASVEAERRNIREENPKGLVSGKGSDEDGENLTLKLGGSYPADEEPVVRPNKRVRSGSPGSSGSGNYPMCQVDDCKADLSNAKDYHRRHKVCEIHSKTTKALVGNQMQRFCQQCSRFHPLSEFDEGKRSCRRRLAGHNRRRRKIQPEDASSRMLLTGNRENNGSTNFDIVNLLSMLARLQGNGLDKSINNSALLDKDKLLQILSKLNTTTSTNSKAKLSVPGGFDLNVPQTPQASEQQSKANGIPSAPSTMNLLAVLSGALKSPNPDRTSAVSQGSSGCSADDKAKINCLEPSTGVNSHNQVTAALPPPGVGRSSCALQTSVEHPLQQAKSTLPLQLFSSAEDDSPPKVGSSRKYLSSESSNPIEEVSPSSSPPVVQKLFPLNSAAERLKNERISIFRADTAMVETSTSQRWSSPLQPIKDSERRAENQIVQNSHYRAGGYTSSSGSDHSPSSSNSDAHDRTGQIIFKLFDKNPSDFPGTLRTQILNWLSHIPAEMESYIRPGCVLLSVYLSMSPMAWDELQEDLLQRIHVLLQCTDSDFWKNGRFLVRTDRQLASHKDGKIRLCKTWKTWSSPELMSVSPLGVVSGKETPLLLRGRNLTVPGTKIHCTYMGGYTSKEVLVSAYPGTIYDDSSMESFNFPGGTPDHFGRCFIEVENGFKGSSFPIIIADESICQELRVLESELEDVTSADVLDDQAQEHRRPRSRDDILHFLNELGWLFQRKSFQSSNYLKDFSCTRMKFLLIFAVERDWSAVVGKLLDIFVERSSGRDELIQESLEALSEVQLLRRAVKRRCRKMVDLLLFYSVDSGFNSSKVYLFPPNHVGSGGVTPLHLAASTQESEDMVDALTNDPQEIGLNCWNSVVDDNGQSPYAYASMRNNHAYNRLVATKLADRRSGQVSITVENQEISLDRDQVDAKPLSVGSSCTKCAIMERRRSRGTIHSQGLLRRPYVHSMLAIAAVCVCVCLFLRGGPQLGSVALFKWENLDFGPR